MQRQLSYQKIKHFGKLIMCIMQQSVLTWHAGANIPKAYSRSRKHESSQQLRFDILYFVTAAAAASAFCLRQERGENKLHLAQLCLILSF
jgi:hypothetical protein